MLHGVYKMQFLLKTPVESNTCNDTLVNQSKNEGNSKCNKFILPQFIIPKPMRCTTFLAFLRR